jgi:hypothetical protein
MGKQRENIMSDYDPSDFRATAAKVAAAWLTAVIFMIVIAATVLVSDRAGSTQFELHASNMHQR